MRKPTGDYPVGYCRPPDANKFRPGQSGNPGGRPKEIIDHDQVVEEELMRKIQIKENGQMVTLTTHRAMVRTACLMAIKGKFAFADEMLRVAKSLSIRRSSAARSCSKNMEEFQERLREHYGDLEENDEE